MATAVLDGGAVEWVQLRVMVAQIDHRTSGRGATHALQLCVLFEFLGPLNEVLDLHRCCLPLVARQRSYTRFLAKTVFKSVAMGGVRLVCWPVSETWFDVNCVAASFLGDIRADARACGAIGPDSPRATQLLCSLHLFTKELDLLDQLLILLLKLSDLHLCHFLHVLTLTQLWLLVHLVFNLNRWCLVHGSFLTSHLCWVHHRWLCLCLHYFWCVGWETFSHERGFRTLIYLLSKVSFVTVGKWNWWFCWEVAAFGLADYFRMVLCYYSCLWVTLGSLPSNM